MDLWCSTQKVAGGMSDARAVWLLLLAIGVFLIVLVMTFPASSHSWYPSTCCNGRDCHPVSCEEIVPGRLGMYDGYWWRRYKSEGQFFTQQQHHWSQDADCHVCVSISETKTEIPRCIFTTPPVQS